MDRSSSSAEFFSFHPPSNSVQNQHRLDTELSYVSLDHGFAFVIFPSSF
jgi:hypothetical protein